MIIKQTVGIDCSMKTFDCCFSTIDEMQKIKIKGTRKFKQTREGFDDFIKWTKKFIDDEMPLFFIVEATGVYHENLAWYLHKHDFNISVILPSRAKKFIESTHYKTKTDKIDSKALAQYGLERNTELWTPLSENIYKIRINTRELNSLNCERTIVKNKIHARKQSAYGEKGSLSRLEQRLKFIEKQIDQVKKSIAEFVDQDEKLKMKVENLTSIKGVGLITAATVIAETNGFALIKSQGQLISYAGLDVVHNDSGKKLSKGRISKKGNKYLRGCLLMAGFQTVAQKVPVFLNLYRRLIQKGKEKMQIYVAIHKKLLTLLWTLWKKDEKYDPEYYKLTSRIHGANDIHKL